MEKKIRGQVHFVTVFLAFDVQWKISNFGQEWSNNYLLIDILINHLILLLNGQ